MAFSTFHYILNETYRWREKPLQPLRGGEISYATLCLHWAITCSPKRLLILGEREASYILLGASCCFLQLSASYVKVESFFGLAEWKAQAWTFIRCDVTYHRRITRDCIWFFWYHGRMWCDCDSWRDALIFWLSFKTVAEDAFGFLVAFRGVLSIFLVRQRVLGAGLWGWG